jgi:hypothetical protein
LGPAPCSGTTQQLIDVMFNAMSRIRTKSLGALSVRLKRPDKSVYLSQGDCCRSLCDDALVVLAALLALSLLSLWRVFSPIVQFGSPFSTWIS